MRRRLREQLRVREALLLDLGALVYELHRQGKRAPELLQQKAAELTEVDEEVRELQAALDGGELPAQQTTEVEAGEEPEGAGALDEDSAEDAELGEEPGDDDAPDDEAEDDALDEETGEERALDEDEPQAEDETGEADEIAPEDEPDEPTLAEHEEPRA
jgi:hypothetical protein